MILLGLPFSTLPGIAIAEVDISATALIIVTTCILKLEIER